MLKLICLELKKTKIGVYIKAGLIANLVMMVMVYLIGNDANDPINSHEMAYNLIDIFTKAVFTIFAAVLISSYIIDEYRNKTITVMFMYPINRKRLIAAKLIIISVFTFISILMSDIILSIFYEFLNNLTHLTNEQLTGDMILKQLGSYVLSSFEFTGISLISMYFGMRKKSGSSAIISSMIIAVLLGSNVGFADFTLGSLLPVSFTLAAAGILVAYFTIRNIEHKDVIC